MNDCHTKRGRSSGFFAAGRPALPRPVITLAMHIIVPDILAISNMFSRYSESLDITKAAYLCTLPHHVIASRTVPAVQS